MPTFILCIWCDFIITPTIVVFTFQSLSCIAIHPVPHYSGVNLVYLLIKILFIPYTVSVKIHKNIGTRKTVIRNVLQFRNWKFCFLVLNWFCRLQWLLLYLRAWKPIVISLICVDITTECSEVIIILFYFICTLVLFFVKCKLLHSWSHRGSVVLFSH
jgi:hypothetical protein